MLEDRGRVAFDAHDLDAVRLAARDLEKTQPHPIVEGDVFRFEAAAAGVSPPRAREAFEDADVVKQGQVRNDSSADPIIDRGDPGGVQSPSRDLISLGRIGEAITEDDETLGERGPNHLRHVLARVKKKDTRPLLKGRDPKETIEALLAVREPVYAQADITLECPDESHHSALERMLAELRERGLET